MSRISGLTAWFARIKPRYRWGLLLVAALAATGLLTTRSGVRSLPAGTAIPPSADAQGTLQTSQQVGWLENETDDQVEGPSATTVILATLAVVGLAYGCLWLMRFVNVQPRAGSRSTTTLQVRSSVRVGHNQALHLVQFGSSLLLIGASQSGLLLLAEAPAGEAEATAPQFTEALRNALEVKAE